MVVYYQFFIFVLNLLMAGYAHFVCLFRSWHVYLDVEVTPTSTKVHTISASYSVLILVSLLAAFVNVS